MENIRLLENVTEEVTIKAPYVFSLKDKTYVPSKKSVTAATVTTDDTVIEEGIPSINVGDILYEDGNTLKTISYENWVDSLGTPIAVCVVPSSHMEDGNARFMSIWGFDEDGKISKDRDYYNFDWDNNESRIDTPLSNDIQIPCVGHDSSGQWIPDNIVDHVAEDAHLCSDRTDEKYAHAIVPNPLDEGTAWAYNDKDCHIASPYNADGSQNTAFTSTDLNGETIANPLAKFNGKENTATLVSLGSNFVAANLCYNYSTRLTNQHDWYLPSIGELAYIMPRFKKISEAIQKAGGFQLGAEDTRYWSSSEFNIDLAYELDIWNGHASVECKDGYCVRPFISPTF